MVAIFVSFFRIRDVVPFFRRSLFFVAFRNSFFVSGEGCGERVCILLLTYLITFLRIAFSIWRCARCFHGTFSQVNCSHFSGEALSLPSAFVYFAVVSLLVPTVFKVFSSRMWNSMLVPTAAQFVPKTSEFLLSQRPLNSLEITWLT